MYSPVVQIYRIVDRQNIYLKYFYNELLLNIHAIDVTYYIYKSHCWNVETLQVWNRETCVFLSGLEKVMKFAVSGWLTSLSRHLGL